MTPTPRLNRTKGRCVRACDNCKRRKEKCNGHKPCAQCSRRGKSPECNFSNISHKNVHSANQSQSMKHRVQQYRASPNDPFRDNVSINSSVSSNINPLSLPNERFDHGREMVDTDIRSIVASRNMSPSAIHFLDDGEGEGNVFFVGQSATLAFEEVVRRVVEDSIGSCAFTTDPKRSSMPEGSPEDENKSVAFWTKAHIPALSVNEVHSLAAYYQTSIHGICDLFDPEIFAREIHDWALEGLLETKDKHPIFLLALAIGAQQRGQPGDQEIANKFFLRAQQHTLCFLNGGMTLQTIQSHVLIALYMLNNCQRNGAFMNLGIAARAACALGIHRNESNSRFTSEESRARARAWKTLRVLDTFTSITLGRPPATSEPGSSVLWGRRPSNLSVEEQIDCACVRLCHISERIVGELYHQKSVCIELVESISQHFREWATDLPALFGINDNDENEFDPASLPDRLCLSHLSGAYYYCIIILTKTFLVEEIKSMLQKRSTDDKTGSFNTDPSGSSSSPGSAFIVPCISSAKKSIDIAQSLTNYQSLPGGSIWW